MKKFILCALLTIPNILLPQKNSSIAQEYKSLVLKFANKYLTKQQVLILQDYYCGPECYTKFVGGKYIPWDKEVSTEEVLKNISSIVHESTHHYNHSGKFVIGENSNMTIEETPVFKSSQVASEMIRKNELASDMLRFDTYVNTNSNSSSSVDGIYGLMNEYCAYYNDALASLRMYEAFENLYLETGKDSIQKIKKDFALRLMSSITAFYEFNSFIGAYLLHAKKHRPIIYEKIRNNYSLVTAYSIVTINFQEIVEKSHELFPLHNYKIVREWGSGKSTTTYGNNESLLVSQSVYNDYISMLNEFHNSTNLKLNEK
ncbi:MAG: hypothetical protein CMP51_02555 [Flavobacteriales bacterium]|nr:hypothetical protein [Flavobacteriales bacterium]